MADGIETFENVVIVGFGETPYHKKEPWHPVHYLIDAARRTIEASSLQPEQIDGLGVASFLMPPENVCTVAEHLGLELTWTMHGAQGGASSVLQTLRAAEAIERGAAEAILVVAGDAFTVGSHMDLMDRFNPPVRDYIAPYGFGGTNGLFALIQRRHMHTYGTAVEQLGKIAVTQRRHASLNENALLREPLTLEDYLSARMIADPFRLYDCVLPCGGGGGVLVTSRQLAEQIPQPRVVRVLAGAEHTNYQPHDPVMLEGGWAAFSEGLFRKAGVSHSDMDFVQLYDDYPIMVAIQLEDLGFCSKGRVGAFIEETDFFIEGDLPLNTGGGQLSCGQPGAAGGILGLVEGVRQLQGLGGLRQVKDAKMGLVSGYGMVGFGHGLATAALILSNE